MNEQGDRYRELRALARRLDVDAIALVPGANFARLFAQDFHQNERPLLVLIPESGPPAAVVPALELQSFELLGFEGPVYDWRDQIGYQSAFDAMLEAHSLESIAVEGQGMRVFVRDALIKASPSLSIRDCHRDIGALRLHKRASEIEALERAIAISETALAETIDTVRIGQSEKDIEAMLLQRLFANGADDLSFGPIVAAGDNAARPHASARREHEVGAGETLLIDFGARVDGLCADITRTFLIDHCPDRIADAYATVLAANEAGIACAAPTATADAVDDAATSVLERSPFAEFIRTKTGHGLGRDVHEDPYIMRGNEQKLEPGMVFTVEPGLYVSGEFGIRIEDDVLITESGARVLTHFDKSLQVIGRG